MQLLCSVFLCVFRTLTVPCSEKNLPITQQQETQQQQQQQHDDDPALFVPLQNKQRNNFPPVR